MLPRFQLPNLSCFHGIEIGPERPDETIVFDFPIYLEPAVLYSTRLNTIYFEGEYRNVNKKILLTLLLVISMLGIFTGCEPVSSIPEIIGPIKGYNDELVALLMPQVVGHPFDFYTADESLEVDEGIVCNVDETDIEDTTFTIALNNWVANDGTKISGHMTVNVKYYASTGNISSIETISTMFCFNRTSVNYFTEVFDGDADDEAFTSNYDTFRCISLIVDGKTLINTYMYYV